MTYDIFSGSAPAMPKPGRGTKIIKLITSQVSPEMREAVTPTLFDAAAAHISGSEFQYPDLTWKELCGMMANFTEVESRRSTASRQAEDCCSGGF